MRGLLLGEHTGTDNTRGLSVVSMFSNSALTAYCYSGTSAPCPPLLAPLAASLPGSGWSLNTSFNTSVGNVANSAVNSTNARWWSSLTSHPQRYSRHNRGCRYRRDDGAALGDSSLPKALALTGLSNFTILLIVLMVDSARCSGQPVNVDRGDDGIRGHSPSARGGAALVHGVSTVGEPYKAKFLELVKW